LRVAVGKAKASVNSAYVWNLKQLSDLSPMPRYYFDVHHERSDFDPVGEELPDRHAAWSEATVTAGRMLPSLDGKLRPGLDWQMEVTDEFANPLYVIHIIAKQPN
jgi:hypothetical protein